MTDGFPAPALWTAAWVVTQFAGFLLLRRLIRVESGGAAEPNGPEQLVASIPLPACALDPDDRIVAANAESHLLLGRAPATLAGYRCEDLGTVEWDRTDEERRSRHMRIRLPHPDGVERLVDLQIRRPREDEAACCWVATMDDVTAVVARERERAELLTRIQQGQRLETMGTMAGGIAHDFNNLLAPIIGYAEMAGAELDPADELRADLEQIVLAAERARDLVAQMMSFARPDGSTRSGLHLASVAREVLGLLRASVPSTIQLHGHLDSSTPPVRGNATEFHQVLLNLCTNASHALPDGGTIEVVLDTYEPLATDDLELPAAGESPFVRLRVRDDGTGMDPETLSRIFDPFFTTKEKGKGTGLGLATVREIVSEMRGSISAQSEPGVGTVFTLLFPPDTEVTAPAETVEGRGPATGSGRVLLVDDDSSVLDVTTRGLSRLGYSVTPFGTPEAALAAFESDPSSFDLLLTDQSMPGLPGLSLARRLRARQPSLPVVLTSGYPEEVSAEQVRDLGGCHFLAKPASPGKIGDTVARALRNTPDPPRLRRTPPAVLPSGTV